MRTSSTTTGLMTIVLAAGGLAMFGSVAIYAQDLAHNETNERLHACAALSGMTEQLQCFNAIVDSLDPGPVATVVESSSAVVATVDVAASGIQTGAATVSTVVATAPGEESTAADVSTPAAVKTDEVVTAPPAAEDSFGLETVKAKAAPKKEEQKKQQIKTIHATIVSAWPTVDKRFEARLDNGQVWRETARTRRNRLPKAGSPVVISRGALGSYKMKIGNDNRLSAVRRTK